MLQINYKMMMKVKALHENCPNTVFFLVRVFSYSDWILRDTEYLSVFSPNAGKYGLEKTPYLDTSRSENMSLLKLVPHTLDLSLE